MWATGGEYPVPSSEASYLTHGSLIDTAIPFGGTLQADGSWSRVSNAFVIALPGLAQEMGHRYTPALNPGHGDTTNLYAVLDDPRAQAAAAAAMMDMATSDFDAPWDAIIYDAPGLKVAGYPAKQADFINLLAECAGGRVPFLLATKGHYTGDTMFPPLATINAGGVILYCYNINEPPYSVGPLWWQRACVEYALANGVAESNLYLGQGLFSRLWLDGEDASRVLTNEQALRMAKENGAPVRWIESDNRGLVREKCARMDNGVVWLSDGDTIRQRLGLVDEYKLAGIMLYSPGLGDESVWRTIADWKRPRERMATRLHIIEASEAGD